MLKRAFTVLIFVLAMTGFAQAQSTSFAFGSGVEEDAPIEIKSDALSVEEGEGTALFTGNVLVIRGEMRMTAPWVKATYSEDQSRILFIKADQGVTMVSGEDAAEARSAVYDLDKSQVELTNRVVVAQGFTAMNADKMVVNLKNGTASLSGNVVTVLKTGD